MDKAILERTYCENCLKEVDYGISIEERSFVILGSSVVINYEFYKCLECGKELYNNELFKKNTILVREKYITQYNIITVKEIQDIFSEYNLEGAKKELSALLGWGPIFLSQYLNGKLPSKEHSDTLREIQYSPEIMRNLLKIHMKKKIYCTECDFLQLEEKEMQSESGVLMKIVDYKCEKFKKSLINPYSNIYIPCNECGGKYFKPYTTGPERLRPNDYLKMELL